MERLLLVTRMKPLELSLDEMHDLLSILNALEAADDTAPQRTQLRERLSMYSGLAEQRIDVLRGQLDSAGEFAEQLHDHLHGVRSSGGKHQH